MERAQEGHFHRSIKGVIILRGVSLIEIGLDALGFGEEQQGNREGLEGLDEVIFPSIPLGQGEEESRGVSGIESSQKGAEGWMRLFTRGPLGSTDDDA